MPYDQKDKDLNNTEAPFSGKYWDTHEKRIYKCKEKGIA